MMNRRNFFTRLGLGTILGIVGFKMMKEDKTIKWKNGKFAFDRKYVPTHRQLMFDVETPEGHIINFVHHEGFDKPLEEMDQDKLGTMITYYKSGDPVYAESCTIRHFLLRVALDKDAGFYV